MEITIVFVGRSGEQPRSRPQKSLSILDTPGDHYCLIIDPHYMKEENRVSLRSDTHARTSSRV
ncbi:hypothetical protein E2C01_080753 [Portunus trituberculatus]|uniref:Uncharacterized protein n=1 Tax=Portunus trituberculatus TaxID=210409 RepID=A0A5B7IWX5_PORTR|nr:hypothetical protein [Portunus trituberculatus]